MNIPRLLTTIFVLNIVAFPAFAKLQPSSTVIGEVVTYQIKKGDTLNRVAGRYGLGLEELMWANPTISDPTKIYIGKKIILPTAFIVPTMNDNSILINLPELRLYYFYEKDGVAEIKTFPITVGQEGKSTPIGKTKIFDKRENPAWIVPDSVRQEDPTLPEIVPPGPENPLGNYILDLDATKNKKWQSIKIHGTNVPWKIGMKVSHGCIRLYPRDIQNIFDNVTVGTEVRIVNYPIKVAEVDNEVFIEVHPDLSSRNYSIIKSDDSDDSVTEVPLKNYDYPSKDIFDAHGYICKLIKDCEEKLDWPTINKEVMKKRGFPILVSKELPEPDLAK